MHHGIYTGESAMECVKDDNLRTNNNIYCNLLQSVKKNNNQFDLFNAELSQFNIFKVLRIADKEVLICRLIGELLDPDGSHELGYKPLESFLNIIDYSENFSSDDLKSAVINLEEVIDDERRIDIVIYIKNCILPIEVKIWAGDQENQLRDYYQYFRDRAKYIYYLTPHGKMPSQYSFGNLPGNKIKCLSFTEHIKRWLFSISKAIPKNQRILTMLEQFNEVIMDMSKENDFLQNIVSVLNLDNDQTFEANENIKALLYILNANSQEALWRRIRDAYLHNQLKSQLKSYKINYHTTDIKKDYCIFEISNEEKVIAQICVEQNLYIVVKRIKPDHDIYWKEGDGWWWRYLSPGTKNNKKIQMNTANTQAIDAIVNNLPIHIEEILNQIVPGFDMED